MIDNKLQFGRETETVPKKDRSHSFRELRWISWDKTSEYFTVVNLWNSLRRDLHHDLCSRCLPLYPEPKFSFLVCFNLIGNFCYLTELSFRGQDS